MKCMLRCASITGQTQTQKDTMNFQAGKVKKIFKVSFGGSLVRTVIYTIGHMCIAITCLMLIADVNFRQALTDAIVEPLLNGVWYFILDRLWIKYFSNE